MSDVGSTEAPGNADGWDVLSVDDLDAISVAGVVWHPIRRRLGIHAFGVNAYTAERAGEHVIEEHDESTSGAGGHEELYVVLRGHATFTVDGETRAAPAGTMVFLRDPKVRRSAVADEEGTLVLAIGGEPGKAYEVSPWEHSFAAAPALARGDWDEAIALIEAGLAEHPDNPSLNYNLACAESRAGRTADALEHLGRAIAAKPEYVKLASEDVDFDAIRGEPGFPTV
jgi:tetratricopeptide (TPR) repeat protein